MIKKYWVVAWDSYYPDGGLNNVVGSFETLEEAEEFAESYTGPYSSSIRPDHVEVEDVSYLLF